MIARSLRSIATAVRGRIASGEPTTVARGVAIDSRRVEAGDLFVAIVGPRHDGHAFAEEALRRGAAAVVGSRDPGLPATAAVVRVDDTTDALGRLAADERRRRDAVFVGITGSSGKTTTRRLTEAALSARFRTASSPGNLNNQWGVPLSILGLADDVEVAVLELAMNAPGEIAGLTRIAAPSVGVVTNVGTAHIGKLGSVEAIAAAKTELLVEMPADGIGVVHAGSPELVVQAMRSGRRLLTFDLDDAAASLSATILSTDLVRGSVFRVGDVEGRLQLWGAHAVLNALAALTTAQAMGVPLGEASARLAQVEPLPGRGRVHRLADAVVVVDESYNANPSAMRAVLDALRSVPVRGRRIAVLGDMKELGDHAARYHDELGQRAVACGATVVVAVGELAERVAQSARAAGAAQALALPDAEAASERVAKLVEAGDLVLVKGSRSVGLEAVRDALVARGGEGGR